MQRDEEGAANSAHEHWAAKPVRYRERERVEGAKRIEEGTEVFCFAFVWVHARVESA